MGMGWGREQNQWGLGGDGDRHNGDGVGMGKKEPVGMDGDRGQFDAPVHFSTVT